jgi:hypothetical protein
LNKSRIETNISENRITLIFAKILTKKGLDTFYTDVRFATADLKPGFNVIASFSQTKFLFLNGLGVFRKIFNFLLSSNSGEIIRVIQDNRIIYKQLLNLSLRIPGYAPVYASNIEEAESKINKPERRNGLRFNLMEHPVLYCIDGQKHNGIIKNISTSGCAILTTEIQPDIRSVIHIMFSLNDQKKQSKDFSIKSMVVRAEDDLFAVSFMGIDKTQKEALWNCIVITGC